MISCSLTFRPPCWNGRTHRARLCERFSHLDWLGLKARALSLLGDDAARDISGAIRIASLQHEHLLARLKKLARCVKAAPDSTKQAQAASGSTYSPLLWPRRWPWRGSQPDLFEVVAFQLWRPALACAFRHQPPCYGRWLAEGEARASLELTPYPVGSSRLSRFGLAQSFRLGLSHFKLHWRSGAEPVVDWQRNCAAGAGRRRACCALGRWLIRR